ncbi:MAG: hypothetical protein WBO55_16120 [Rhizobiaceae bacterium]
MMTETAKPSRRFNASRYLQTARRGVLAAALAAAGVHADQAFAIITNTGQVSGFSPDGGAVTSAPSSETVYTVPPQLLVNVTKSGVLNDSDGRPGLTAGDTIDYTVTVENTGNVSLSALSVADPLVTLIYQSGDVSNSSILDVGETWTYTGSYLITQSDLDTNAGGTGQISNSVTVNGTGPGSTGTASGSASFDFPITQNPSLSIVKSGVLTTDGGQPGRADLGDVITYTYAVTNNGNVTITGIAISDVHSGSDPLTTPHNEFVSGDVAPLSDSTDVTSDDGIWSSIAPGDTVTFTTTYTTTQTDVDNQ